MQIDKLQIDLHPRANAHALDVGFALLRSHAVTTYRAWLTLWLPLLGLCFLLALWFPSIGAGWLFLAWWLKPLVERAPLYVLSRQVFGESVSWQDAVRAWPGQLKGGWFRLLTWWRLFVPGRGLYQAIWQLEGARGAVAAQRRKVIGGRNTGTSAGWYGVVCAHFEVVLQLGCFALIGLFISDENSINPFALLINPELRNSQMVMALTFVCYAIPSAIMGPIYTACCFTLYLNRRATLEAWDIELTLRQAAAQQTAASSTAPTLTQTNRTQGVVSALLGAAFTCALLWPTAPVWAQDNSRKNTPSPATNTTETAPSTCEPAAFLVDAPKKQRAQRKASHHPSQTQIRQELDALMDTEDLRGYQCIYSWLPKDQDDTEEEKKEKTSSPRRFDFSTVATILQVIAITLAIIAIIWLWRRYGSHIMHYIQRPHKVASATEVGGLDIRPETLPEDVASTAKRLWQQGQHREALALLYRATLSRLVNQDQLSISQGATEGDCLRLAHFAQQQQRLTADKLGTLQTISDLWLRAAYGRQWPEEQAVFTLCTRWKQVFDAPGSASASNSAASHPHQDHLSA